MQEQKRLENIAQNYAQNSAQMVPERITKAEIDYAAKLFLRYCDTSFVLEMGPAQGLMSGILAANSSYLDILEGSEVFANNLKNRFFGNEKVRVFCELFENFSLNLNADSIKKEEFQNGGGGDSLRLAKMPKMDIVRFVWGMF